MKELILKHVLFNAIQHNGKANVGAVVGKVLGENPNLKKDMNALMKEITKTVNEINSWPLERQKQKLDEMGFKIEKKTKEESHELPELCGVKGEVVMRMAPYPSGPLHIGNSRMAILNDEYVKRYKGKLILVIDDTIGSEEKLPIKEAYEMIPDGLKWLGIDFKEVYRKSDRMEIFYEYAEKLIKLGAAYVCECESEILRKNRREGKACKCRGQSIEENMDKWKRMLAGFYEEGKATVRLKTDIKHPNPSFRDRVLLRICKREHPMVGKKYHVWPMLEFSWAIDDHLLGITHILRGKDLVIEDLMEDFIWKIFGWEKPVFMHYGMLKIQGIKLSKSQTQKTIKEGVLSGWDDPRTWSLQSLRRRGIRPEAIRNFILSFGMSMNDIVIPVDNLYTENRKIIEPLANRYFAVIEPFEISVLNSPVKEEAKEPLHPDYPERGHRTIPVNVQKIFISKSDFEKYKGKTIRLIGLFNIKLNKNAEYKGNEIVQEMPKIQWVSEKNIPVKILMENGDIETGVAEPDISKLQEGDLIQFMRIGFCRLDNKKEMKFYFTHR